MTRHRAAFAFYAGMLLVALSFVALHVIRGLGAS